MNADLRIGVITKAHGIRGEVKVYPTTDSPLRFRTCKHVVLKCAGRTQLCDMTDVRFFKNLVICRLSGLNTPEDAEKWKGADLYVEREEGVPLGENEYYIADIIGMKVVDEEENPIGTVRDVLETGANDVYVVAREGKKDLLLPAIRDCILKIDGEQNRMTVHVMDGLMDL